ncbi:MAG: PEP-CTERM sorting domain-containing protein [Bryobacterales bacterium]|nr:PEP-CTERM sorting domain-containing protein [Bryobacterales bacterium]
MAHVLRLAMVAALLAAVSLEASVITFVSGDGVGEGNSLTAANVVIIPDPSWQPATHGAQWVSYEDTGDTGTRPPASPTAIASFFEFIDVPAPLTGSLTAWADDTVDVYLNGVLLMPAAAPVAAPHCTVDVITCRPDGGATVSLTAHLQPGVNTIRLDAYQYFNGPFGVLYYGSITATDTPEPGTWLLSGCGLLGLGALLRRRRS